MTFVKISYYLQTPTKIMQLIYYLFKICIWCCLSKGLFNISTVRSMTHTGVDLWQTQYPTSIQREKIYLSNCPHYKQIFSTEKNCAANSDNFNDFTKTRTKRPILLQKHSLLHPLQNQHDKHISQNLINKPRIVAIKRRWHTTLPQNYATNHFVMHTAPTNHGAN